MARVRTEARREAILDIAAQVFREMGFERASMAEIAARVGGSKATLYGYFASKEELFVEVTRHAGGRHLDEAFSELAAAAEDLPAALRRFGERMLVFVLSPEAQAAHRMVIAESAHSEGGKLFYECGPKQGIEKIASALAAAMDAGQLRRSDANVAALHLVGLLDAEIRHRWFYRDAETLSRAQIKAIVERAVAVFLRGYAP